MARRLGAKLPKGVRGIAALTLILSLLTMPGAEATMVICRTPQGTTYVGPTPPEGCVAERRVPVEPRRPGARYYVRASSATLWKSRDAEEECARTTSDHEIRLKKTLTALFGGVPPPESTLKRAPLGSDPGCAGAKVTELLFGTALEESPNQGPCGGLLAVRVTSGTYAGVAGCLGYDDVSPGLPPG